jgi:ligand-binding sensor protein
MKKRKRGRCPITHRSHASLTDVTHSIVVPNMVARLVQCGTVAVSVAGARESCLCN